jgi:sRNA-binding protein
MEILVIGVLVAIAGVLLWSSFKPAAVVTKALDANGDGKVDLGDAVYLGDVAAEKTKAVAAKAKTAVKKTAAKAKTAVKKTAAKKTVAAKKPTTAKKPVAPKKSKK